ncbi:MAG TPA: cupin domain-containing protein [Gemmatimonadales bacterium]|nr:cupin domain-containing protein [Gemmatimonadales bacterium]
MPRAVRPFPLLLIVLALACARPHEAPRPSARAAILRAGDGESRILRGRKPILLKIDPVTVGSRHLFLGTELMAPGDSIPVHRHLHEEEAVFVHRGKLEVRVADQRGTAEPGGTVFIPESTWISIRNPGPDTAEFVYVFNEPAFAQCLRAFSTRPGIPYHEPGPDSARAIRRACHQDVRVQ